MPSGLIGMSMMRSYELRIKPSKAQATAFDGILRDSQETYNAALQERIEAWRLCHKSIGLYDQCAELTALRQDPVFAVIAADIQREPLRRIDRAMKAFFRRVKAGEKPGFPRFRSLDRYDSFAWGQPSIYADYLIVPNLGYVKFKAHREMAGKPKRVVIKRRGPKWVAHVVCDIGAAPARIAVSSAVGIDVGLTTLATLSNGTAIENPRWARKRQARIAAVNRSLAGKQRRSKNRVRAKEVLRRAHQRVADARKNYIHHVSKKLVEDYDLIAYEDLRISNMARSVLGKSIMDAAWGLLIRYIAYKAEYAGKWFIPVNPRGTSQRCSGCGVTVPKDLSERLHTCTECGLILGRDYNAARNILSLGKSAVGVLAKGFSQPITI